MSLGSKIKQLRQEKSWSPDELAFHAQIDGRQISRYENDKVTPSVEVASRADQASQVNPLLDRLDFFLGDHFNLLVKSLDTTCMPT
ncbi:MAG: helix-turn-helix domain-containing protein [Proteobacteria bacterium]|nr:helix-turn-helix domain-containing protein [Pseudomonadota bacterium]